jgi:hypothetical protein
MNPYLCGAKSFQISSLRYQRDSAPHIFLRHITIRTGIDPDPDPDSDPDTDSDNDPTGGEA